MCEYRESESSDHLENILRPVTPTTNASSTEATHPNCPFCQETTKTFTLLRKFKCGHLAHQKCIKGIIERCPVCRADLTGEIMLCRKCLSPITTVFHDLPNERFVPECEVCFRDGLSEEICSYKEKIVNLYRHIIALDKESFNVKKNYDASLLDGDDAFKEMKTLQEGFTGVCLDGLLKIINCGK
jgi:hypothetical protein